MALKDFFRCQMSHRVDSFLVLQSEFCSTMKLCVQQFKQGLTINHKEGWRCWCGNWAGPPPKWCERGCAFWKRTIYGGKGAALSGWESFVPVCLTWGPTRNTCEILGSEASPARYGGDCGVAGS